MLGSISIFSAKGMVSMPNLTGLSNAGVQQALTASGLKYNNSGSVSTQNSNLNGILATQSVAPGTLVDYETTISYETYTYVATSTPTPAPTSGTTTTVYFAYCSGENLVSSGTSNIDGTDVSAGCTTLRTQSGNPTGWVCGTTPNPSPSVSCSTPAPTSAPVTYNCRAWLFGSSQMQTGYYSSSTNDDNQGSLPCNQVSILCVQAPSVPGTNLQAPYTCPTATPTPTTTSAPTWYCSTSLPYSTSQGQYTSTTNESGSQCNSYRTVCSTSGYLYAAPPDVCATTAAPTTSAPTTAAPTSAPTTAAPACTPSCGGYSLCTGIYRYRTCTASDCSTYSEYSGC